MTDDSELIQNIRAQQRVLAQAPLKSMKPTPQVLLMGCIDARKDLHDIGFFEDNTTTLRNIAATVVKNEPGDGDDPESVARQQAAIKQNIALNKAIKQGITDIVIMGHTSCGGMQACCSGTVANLPAVQKHLDQYQGIKEEIDTHKGRPTHSQNKAQDSPADEMSRRAVRLSVDNLKTYPVVAEALKSGLQIHGWVINTHTGAIEELNHGTGLFDKLDAPSERDTSEAIARIRQRQQYFKETEHFPIIEHNPKMLIIGGMAAPIDAKKIGIPYGNALIYREWDPCSPDMSIGQEAALQFALQAKNMKDVVLMMNTGEEKALWRGLNRIKQYPPLAQAVKAGIKLHGWLMDPSKRIAEMDLDTGRITPMAGDAPAEQIAR